MGQFFDGWVASEAHDHDAIKVKRLYVDINEGNWYDAALFSQIMYWHGRNKETGERRMKVLRNGEYWIAKRYEDWWDECRVNAETAKKAIVRMVKRGLLVKQVWLFSGKPTVHLRINVEGFEVLANHSLAEKQEFELNRSNVPDGKGTIDQMDQVRDTDLYTETTAETTAEVVEASATTPPVRPDSSPLPPNAINFEALYTPKPQFNDTIAWMERPKYFRAFEAGFPTNAKVKVADTKANREAADALHHSDYTTDEITETVRELIGQGKASLRFDLIMNDMSKRRLSRNPITATPVSNPEVTKDDLPDADDFLPLDADGRYVGDKSA